MNIKKYLLTALAVAAAFLNAAAWNSSKYNLQELELKVEHGLVKLAMTVDPAKYRVSYNQQMELTPVLRQVGGNDSIVFPTVVVAGRNAYYNTEREGKFAGTLLRARTGKPLQYTAETEWQDWMTNSRLDLLAKSTGCCNAPKGSEPDLPVAEIDFRPITFMPAFHYEVPVAEERKTRRIEGKAYVNFPVNRTEIYPDYMVNPVELRKITNSVDSVRLNPDCTVKSITLTGFASPEGPYANNVRLAAGRTEAVKEYVRGQYTFPKSVFHTNSVPEDWEGLRDSVANSILPDRAALLDFIDNGNVPIERRNDVFRAKFPQSYAYLLKHIYPSLRHTNYAIDYEIRSYTDINEIRRVLKERPQNLSLNEFFIAANSYEEGSEEYDKVFETAVLYYPDSEVANLNAANSAINEGDYKRARMLLNRVKSPSGVYALGILDAMEGNYDAAAEEFKAAKEAGMTEAEGALKQLEYVKAKRNQISYFPEQ